MNGRGLACIDQLSHVPVALDFSNDVTKNEQMLDIGGGEDVIRVFKFSSTNPDFQIFKFYLFSLKILLLLK